MYLAQKIIDKSTHYVLRESCTVDDRLTFRNLFELGRNPSDYIVYPGGNAYYISEDIFDTLTASGVQYDAEGLEDLFWPFVRSDIRRAINHFRHRSWKKEIRPKLSDKEIDAIQRSVHPFDKRRLHYLRFGNMDQGPTQQMPPVLMKRFLGKCRDEIEQYFLKAERQLKATEFKTYVYTAFNLQRFFSSIIAKRMPQALDQTRVDNCFLEAICRINDDLFTSGENQSTGSLNEYLLRYLFMFFDYDYADSTLLDDYVKDFIYRHRFPRTPPPEKSIPIDKAGQILEMEKDDLKTMTRKSLTRQYRIMAHKVHPDKGGSHEKFVELNKAYESLLRKIGRKT